jgi:hypothetical protein
LEGEIAAAIMLLLQFRSYIRPGVFDALTVGQLVPPTPSAGHPYNLWSINLHPSENLIPGKTGFFDQAILLDTELWLDPFLRLLVTGRHPESPLWPITPGRLGFLFLSSVERLGMSSLRPVRYSLRHGGASDDLLTGFRTLLAVKRRGHWQSDNSLRRYGKEARASMELRKLSTSVVQYATDVNLNLEAIFHQARSPPLPALLPSTKRQRL